MLAGIDLYRPRSSKGLRTWVMYSAFQDLTSLCVLCLCGHKISSLLGYRPRTILPVFLSCFAPCPDCSLLWTMTQFPAFLHKDTLAKTCCHCTHKDRNRVGIDILKTWRHDFVCLVRHNGESCQCSAGCVLHGASPLGGISLSVLPEGSGRWECL